MSRSIYLSSIYLTSSKFTISVVYLREFTCLHNLNNIPPTHPSTYLPMYPFQNTLYHSLRLQIHIAYPISFLYILPSYNVFFFCLSLLPCPFLSTHSSLNYDIGIHTAYPSSLPNLLQLTRYFSFFFPSSSILLTLCSPANSYGTGQPACLPACLSTTCCTVSVAVCCALGGGPL